MGNSPGGDFMKLSIIASSLAAKVKGDHEIEITGIQYDSRKVQPGNLFVCIEGLQQDGHNYIPQAIENGAKAVLIQRPVEGITKQVAEILVDDSREALACISSLWYEFPCRKLRMIGVTGTNGKTTTTHLIKGLLEQKGETVGLVGTIHNMAGDKELASTHTTPESLELNNLLNKMVEMQSTAAVLEVSSHALKQHRVTGCEFDGAVFTNLSQDHLDFHVTWEDYLASKVKLFSHLQIGEKSGTKYAIINADDKVAPEFIKAAQVPVWTYAVKEKAMVKAENIKILPHGTNFTINCPQGEFDVAAPLIGMFNIYNVLAAVSVALAEGMSFTDIRNYLARASQVAGRFELINEGQPFTVIVDYAHTPDGLENILLAAKEITQGCIITVFGCGGDRDRTKRPIMGEISGKHSGFSIVTSDNPRTENPQKIIDDIKKGISQITNEYKIVENRREAIKEAIIMAKNGDMVVIAGKGHETYQQIGNTKLPFDDREVAREILKNI